VNLLDFMLDGCELTNCVYLLNINYYALNLDELWSVNFGCLDCFELMVVYLWSYGLMVVWYFQTNSVL
jgi:hypothetical protein